MAKFRKTIGRPGVFRVNTLNGKEIKALPVSYWKSVYDTTKEMLKAGLKIPSPYAHRDNNKIVPGPVVEQEGKSVDAATLEAPKWTSDFNAGFITDVELDKDNQLVAIFDLPGNEQDINTPAGKARKTIKETSVFIEPEFTDGLGRTWKNALRHVALVTNPVDPGQSDFELISDTSDYALAMSFSMADEVGGFNKDSGSGGEKDTSDVNAEDTTTDPTSDEDSTVAAKVPEIITLIKEKLGFEMPSDTDEKNFLDRLLTILVSIKQEQNPDEEMKDLDKKPKESETESSAVVMSNENPDNVTILEKLNKMVAKQVADMQEQFMLRINKLIASGRLSKKYAEATLVPAVKSIAMSNEDLDEEGNFPKTAVEMAIEMAEGQVSILDDITFDPNRGTVESHDDDAVVMTKDEQENLYAEIL